MNNKLKLLDSQRELLRIKRARINEAIMIANQRDAEFTATLNTIALEVGVPKSELGKWKLSKDDECMEKIREKKDPKLTTVKGDRKK